MEYKDLLNVSRGRVDDATSVVFDDIPAFDFNEAETILSNDHPEDPETYTVLRSIRPKMFLEEWFSFSFTRDGGETVVIDFLTVLSQFKDLPGTGLKDVEPEENGLALVRRRVSNSLSRVNTGFNDEDLGEAKLIVENYSTGTDIEGNEHIAECHRSLWMFHSRELASNYYILTDTLDGGLHVNAYFLQRDRDQYQLQSNSEEPLEIEMVEEEDSESEVLAKENS